MSRRSSSHGRPYRGISVSCLQLEFLSDVEAAGFTRDATVYQVEEKVIRAKGADTWCPCSNRLGAAYVDAISGADNAGVADYMLSYTWGYSVGAIVDTLDCYCERNCLEPKRAYMWICCLCINQHRVKEAETRGEQVSFEDFAHEFGSRVNSVAKVIVLMSPWRMPQNLTRVWCAYEIYMALSFGDMGSKMVIVMPPDEETNFIEELFEGTALERMWKALAGVDVERAKASYENDRARILELIKGEFQDYSEFNRRVVTELQSCFTCLAETKMKGALTETRSLENKAVGSRSVAQMLQKIGKLEAADALLTSVRAELLEHVSFNPKTLANASLLTQLGAIKWRIGKSEEAETLFEDAHFIFTSLCASQTRQCAFLMMERGTVQLFHKNIGSAREYYNGARRIFELEGELETIEAAELYRCIGQLMRNERNYTRAIENFSKAHRILEKTGTLWTPEGVVLLTNLGNIKRDAGLLQDACSTHNEAVQIADTLGILHSLEGAGLLMSLGRVNSLLGKGDEALQLFEKARVARVTLGSMTNTGGALLLTYMGMAEESLAHFHRAHEFFLEALSTWEANDAGTHTQAQKCRLALQRLLDRSHEGRCVDVRNKISTCEDVNRMQSIECGCDLIPPIDLDTWDSMVFDVDQVDTTVIDDGTLDKPIVGSTQ